jgi:hypothetical protein
MGGRRIGQVLDREWLRKLSIDGGFQLAFSKYMEDNVSGTP